MDYNLLVVPLANTGAQPDAMMIELHDTVVTNVAM